MSATFATISSRMRINLFSHSHAQEPNPPSNPLPASPMTAAPQPRTGKTFPADEIVWGIVIRDGFDELDDPWYHRGTTQHAYLEGHDIVAICGFRPPQSGPRTRRRARLGLPSPGEHPMCGMCARMVVAPRPRVPVPVHPFRPAIAVPVAFGAVQPAPDPALVAPRATIVPTVPARVPPAGAPTSPWVRRASGEPAPVPASVPLSGSHDRGLIARGIHADVAD